MSGPQVFCEVNTCTHWLPRNLCGAANIDILHEEEGQMAQNREQTECKTFYGKRGLANYLGGMDNVNWGGMAAQVWPGGKDLNPSVTCVVDTCRYWETGNLCHAEHISVSGAGADECQDTNCKTFEMANPARN